MGEVEVTFLCTRCRSKPAVVKRGRKVFLCTDCASDQMWKDMVDSFQEDDESR